MNLFDRILLKLSSKPTMNPELAKTPTYADEYKEEHSDTPVLNFVRHSEKVTNCFGQWHTFHDAEVLWFKVSRDEAGEFGDVTIKIAFIYPLMQRTRHRPEMQRISPSFSRTDYRIEMRFERCVGLKVNRFNNQNQLYGLVFSVENQPKSKTITDEYVTYDLDGWPHLAKEYLKVELDPSYGIGGEFKCYRCEVVSVEQVESNPQSNE